jgi:Cof subfamily protein (haloacid dehalogenase superfamily)
MAKYRMIAIDLDGTLLSPSGQVTPRTKAAVHQTLAAGLLVCFATGRNWTESRMVLEAVAHYGSAVFVGGALVMDTRQRVTLHRTMMDPALAAEVCRALEQTGHAVLALQDTGAAGVDYLVSEGVGLNRETAGWMKLTQAGVRGMGRRGDDAHPRTIRFGICAGADEVRSAQRLLQARFGERLFCQVLQVPQTGVEVLEIFDPAVNKWQGVLHVARAHDVLPAEVIAIGDDVNDLPMIRHAGLGVAMGNARPEVLAAAGRVIGPNAQDGLAEFLEEIVEQHTVEPMPEREVMS